MSETGSENAEEILDEIRALLLETSTKKYHIKFKSGNINHITHGIVALYRLGCTQERIKKFINWYETTLYAPEDFPEESAAISESMSEFRLDNLFGKRKYFYVILNHYEDLLNQQYITITDMVKSEFPKLANGLAGAALHGVIQLGHGVKIGSEVTVLEGLTLMAHSHVPFISDNDKSNLLPCSGTQDILSVLEDISKDVPLYEFMRSEANKPEWAQITSGAFSTRLSILVMKQGNTLTEYVNRIKIPLPGESCEHVADMLSKWLLDCAITVYTMSERHNDFFLLHGVTGSWSLRQVVSLLHTQDAMSAVHTMLCVLLAVYVAQGCPKLTSHIDTSITVDERAWRNIVSEALAKERYLDEHMYKMVHVCRGLWQEDPSNGHLYFASARCAVDNELAFTTYD